MNIRMLKEWQLEVISRTNPAPDSYHTWIRTTDDILTFEESLQGSDWFGWEDGYFDPDYTGDDAVKAVQTGKIRVFSSYNIEPGVFVTPSKMEAQSYSGDGTVDYKDVLLTDVAWIDPTQGQYTGPMHE